MKQRNWTQWIRMNMKEILDQNGDGDGDQMEKLDLMEHAEYG